ncbi:MAG TPA: hypothetical protein VGI03_12845 [Verrucomicrobiae bacterium]|jgi:hypothetical protein
MKRTSASFRLALTGLILTAILQTASAQIGGLWSSITGLPTNTWRCCACSSNGLYCAALTYALPTTLYVSSNSGTTWTQLTNSFPIISGNELVAVATTTSGAMIGVVSNAQVSLSTNSGATWVSTGVAAADISCSPNAQIWLASGRSGAEISTNYGVTWKSLSQAGYKSVCSSDGTRLAYFDTSQLTIWTSLDSGSTWTQSFALDADSSQGGWTDIAISGDGKTLVASTIGDSTADPKNTTAGRVYYSTNFGTNWNTADTYFAAWESVAVSADGQTMTACSVGYGGDPDNFPGMLIVSTDGGTNWAPGPLGNQAWRQACVSSDGSTVLAVNSGNVELPCRGLFSSSGASAPFLSISAVGGGVQLTWPYPEAGYLLQQSPSLNSPVWTTVSNTPAAVNQIVLPTTNNTFYRLANP